MKLIGLVAKHVYEKGPLAGQFSDQEEFEIFPESDEEFFAADFEGEIKFCRKGKKEVSHLILMYDGQPTRANKIRS